MAKKKVIEPPSVKPVLKEGHNIGKYYGFDYRNGKIHLCDAMKSPMEEILNEQTSLGKLVNNIVDHAQVTMNRLTKSERDWWRKVKEELEGLLPNEELDRLSYLDGVITVRPLDKRAVPEKPKEAELTHG